MDNDEICLIFHKTIQKNIMNVFIKEIDFKHDKIPRETLIDLYTGKKLKLDIMRNEKEAKERELIASILKTIEDPERGFIKLASQYYEDIRDGVIDIQQFDGLIQYFEKNFKSITDK